MKMRELRSSKSGPLCRDEQISGKRAATSQLGQFLLRKSRGANPASRPASLPTRAAPICVGRAFGRLLAGSTASTMNQTSRPPGLKVVDRHRRLGDSAALIAAVVHNVVVSVVVTPPSALLYRGNWGRGRKRPAESLPLRQVTRIRPPTEKRPFSSSACRRRPGPPLASNQSRLSSRSKRQRAPGSAY